MTRIESNVSLTGYLRVPGRCLSLVYCSSPPSEAEVRLGNRPTIVVGSPANPVELVHRWKIFCTFFKFRSKVLWLKLVLLLMLKRDFWLAVTPDQIVGMLGIRYDKLSQFPLNACEAAIYSIIVADEFRGQRLGMLLLEEATMALFRNGCQLVLLETGEHNDSMRRLLGRSRLYRFCGASQRPLPLPQRESVL